MPPRKKEKRKKNPISKKKILEKNSRLEKIKNPCLEIQGEHVGGSKDINVFSIYSLSDYDIPSISQHYTTSLSDPRYSFVVIMYCSTKPVPVIENDNTPRWKQGNKLMLLLLMMMMIDCHNTRLI